MNIIETRLFRPIAQTIIPARTQPFNAAEFFCRPGMTKRELDVCGTFAESFNLHARPTVSSAPARSYVAMDLRENVRIEEILKELMVYPASTLEDIAALLVAQPVRHPPGFLGNIGDANIFSVEGKVVCVDRSDNDYAWVISDYVRSWSVDSYHRVRHGCRVLCPGNAVLTDMA